LLEAFSKSLHEIDDLALLGLPGCLSHDLFSFGLPLDELGQSLSILVFVAAGVELRAETERDAILDRSGHATLLLRSASEAA